MEMNQNKYEETLFNTNIGSIVIENWRDKICQINQHTVSPIRKYNRQIPCGRMTIYDVFDYILTLVLPGCEQKTMWRMCLLKFPEIWIIRLYMCRTFNKAKCIHFWKIKSYITQYSLHIICIFYESDGLVYYLGLFRTLGKRKTTMHLPHTSAGYIPQIGTTWSSWTAGFWFVQNIHQNPGLHFPPHGTIWYLHFDSEYL